MALYLGIVIFAFILTAVSIVPFIDLLFRFRIVRKTVHLQVGDRYVHKVGKPTGIGVLIITLVTAMFALVFPLMRHLGVYIVSNFAVKPELNVVFFTFIAFGLVGLYVDLTKVFGLVKLPPVWFRHLKLLLASLVAVLLYFHLGIHIINVPAIGVLNLGWWYLPFAAGVVWAFTEAFNVTDGLDGLSGGLLLICLLAFWVLSFTLLDTALSVFIALWVGTLIAFLYFNVYPSRVWLGNAGGLAFGATLAVIGLLLGKVVALFVIGGLFMVELISELFHLLPLTPVHNWLQAIGWPEPKITLRAWLTAILLALFGVWLAYL